MGMAASQARFLGLTARKSNVEYQAQQINQQRTALSNEVMGLYNEYNNLDVPTPPAVTDYQKTTYNVDTSNGNYTLDNFTKILEGEYKGYYSISLTCEDTISKAYTKTQKDSVITAQQGANGYSYLNFQFGVDSYTYDENNPNSSTITKITGDYEKYQGLASIMQSQGLTSGTYYMYLKDGIAYYTSEDDLNSTSFENVDGKNRYYGDYVFDYLGAQKIPKTIEAKAALTQDQSGRLSAMQILECEENGDLVNNAYAITTSSKDDELGYQDAMNKYYYDKEMYEREVERINQKTETIQKEDRSLELQLNQLDTEQRALKTEMESISKIIQETIDSVFKTFSG